MIDVHCHLNFHSFEKDYDNVIKQAFEVGVTTIVNVGTSVDSSQKAVDLAKQYHDLFAIIGIHPHHADKNEPDWLEKLDKLAQMEKVVAIGEIGMDYYSYKSNGIVDKKVQKEVFEKQIELAHKHTLPLQIHNRQADKDILEILHAYKSSLMNPPGMFHCMSGDKEFLKNVLDLGFFVGFDGNSTYPGIAPGETTELKELISYAPLDRIVVETDSPFLTPIPHRGSRNEPKYAILVGEFIAEIKGISKAEVSQQTTKNAQALFDISTK